MDLETLLADFSLTSTHIPNTSKDFNDLRLDYQVQVLYKGRLVIATEYHMGIGHIPGYTHERNTLDRDKWIRQACETGKVPQFHYRTRKVAKGGGTEIEPKLADVMYSLVMDSDVINYATFEEWATNYGYDEDSRQAEKVYRACLEIALKFRSGVGEAKLNELREVFQDY